MAHSSVSIARRQRTRFSSSWCASSRPHLTTGPKAALALALEAEATGIDLKFDAYLPHGEALTDDDRAAMLRVFGAGALDLYSSKEAGHIAVGCPEDKGLHVNAESVLVEIVDDRGQPVPPGTLGRVIVTPFFNAAQPLIRYDQGDVAILTEPCRCGPALAAAGASRRSRLDRILSPRWPGARVVRRYAPAPAALHSLADRAGRSDRIRSTLRARGSTRHGRRGGAARQDQGGVFRGFRGPLRCGGRYPTERGRQADRIRQRVDAGTMTISLTGPEKLQRAFFDRLMESQWDAGKQLAMQRAA